MRAKTYTPEKVEKVVQALTKAPALAPKFITHADIISELSKHIKELHFKKHYEVPSVFRLPTGRSHAAFGC